MQTINAPIINVQEIEPKLRHLTIFQTFDKLNPGEHLIIHNNHDPKPVFYQLQEIRGNVFDWEYLQAGPEWWDIKVTKHENAPKPAVIINEKGEIEITVPALEPRLKHETIFFAFEKLGSGKTMIIHNDHDPKPIYYQLQSMHGDIFTWDYITEGPEWWQIRVTKKASAQPNPYINDKGEVVINVPALEPSQKHPTIFNTFERLIPGKTLIIHNDHDPRPLHYHLQNMHGDTFSWEYLQECPEWWDVKIIKKQIEENNGEPNYLKVGKNPSNQKETTITIPLIEPKLKHATIFKIFDTLEVGESLVIHNDHDPKPVYYQLLGERGETFTWEHLEQGPQWWDIRVTKKGTENDETIGEIVAKDIRKAEVLKKFGIDFCCGGNKTVRQVCTEKGIDANLVEQALQQPLQNLTGNNHNYNEWNIDFLADYIVNVHHSYVKKYLPEIVGYAAKVAKVHGPNHAELASINDLVVKVNTELLEHLKEEEGVLFPLIKKLVHAKNSNTKLDGTNNFAKILEELEKEHEQVGEMVDKIRELSNEFAIPEDACTSYKLLYKILQDFEDDLHIHIHLENNILFPKALAIEKELG